jgi:hypothetical protein
MARRRWLGRGAVGLWALSMMTSSVPTLGTWPAPGGVGQRAVGPTRSWMAGRGREAPPHRRESEAPRGNTQEGAVFADWVLSTDPEHRHLLDAFVRDDRVLGVIVHPQLTRGQVQQMLTSLLSAMQRAFPDRPLEVLAYYRGPGLLSRSWPIIAVATSSPACSGIRTRGRPGRCGAANRLVETRA